MEAWKQERADKQTFSLLSLFLAVLLPIIHIGVDVVDW